jgi:hypothetical protein
MKASVSIKIKIRDGECALDLTEEEAIKLRDILNEKFPVAPFTGVPWPDKNPPTSEDASPRMPYIPRPYH